MSDNWNYSVVKIHVPDKTRLKTSTGRFFPHFNGERLGDEVVLQQPGFVHLLVLAKLIQAICGKFVVFQPCYIVIWLSSDARVSYTQLFRERLSYRASKRMGPTTMPKGMIGIAWLKSIMCDFMDGKVLNELDEKGFHDSIFHLAEIQGLCDQETVYDFHCPKYFAADRLGFPTLKGKAS